MQVPRLINTDLLETFTLFAPMMPGVITPLAKHSSSFPPFFGSGASLAANIKLVMNNAAIGAQMAKAYAHQKKHVSCLGRSKL
eukprot:scaffold244840_cov23-Tisochrysis_lutea.AAC.1